MIFRTITDESTGATKSIGLLGKSISELKSTISSIKVKGIINTFFNTSTIDENVVVDYNNAIKEATSNGATMAEKQQIMKSAMEGTNKATAQLIGSTKGAIVETEALTAAQHASTLKARTQAVALKALAVAGNVAVSMLVVGGIKLVDKLITTKKELEEARQKIHDLGKTARSEIDSINSEFESTKSTVDDVAERYATLAQEVGNLGKASQNQGTLSNDEYAEFLEISNQLSDLFPRLTNGYDDNGNAILNLSGNVDTITSSLYNLVDVEKKAASIDIQEHMDKVWGDYSLDVDDYSNQYNALLEKKKDIESFYSKLTSGVDFTTVPYADKILEQAKLDMFDSDGNRLFYNWDDLTEAQKNVMKDAYAEILEEYDKDMRSLSQKIESSNKDFASYLISSLQGTDYYEELGEYKSIINGLLLNYGYDTELYTLRDSENWDEALKQIKKQIIDPFKSLDEEDKKVFDEYYNKLLSIDPESALADNIPKIEEYISKLSELLGIDENILQITLGYDLESDKEELERAKRRLGFKDVPITKDEKEHNELINSIVSDLSKSQIIQINKIDIPEDVEEYTRDEYERFIKQLPQDFPAEISFSIDTIFPQKTILTALSEQKEQGYLTEETLQSLKNIYGDLSEIITYTTNGINLNTEAMTEYANQTAQAALVSTEMREALAVREYNKTAKEVKALCNTNKDLSKAYKQGKKALRDYINTNEDLDDSLKDTLRNSLAQMDDLANKINSYDALENSIRAATSALHDYLKATETANDKDNFETARSGLENAKKAYEQGWTQTDDYRTYMDYIGGYDNVDYLNPDKYIQRAERYLTEDISGIYAFLDDAVALSQGMVTKDADGAYTIAINDLDMFASRMDMTLSQVTDMLLAANDAWDFDIDFESLTDSIVDGLNAIDPASENARQNLNNFKETIESLKEAGYDTSDLEEQFELVSSTINADLEYTLSLSESSKEEVLREAGKYADEVAEHIPAEKITFTAGIEGTNALISQVSEYRDGLAKGTEEFDHAQAVLAGLLQQKRELEVWNIDTSGMSEEMSGAVLIIEQWQNAYADLETTKTLGLDTSEAEAKLNSLTSKLNNIDDTTMANIGLNISDNASVDEIKTALSAIDLTELAENTKIKLVADDSQVKEKLKDTQAYISNTKANINIGAKLEENFTENLQNLINRKTYSVRIGLNNTGDTGGTGGTGSITSLTGSITSLLRLGIPSHAQGTPGIKADETALVGELGQESLVRNGQLYTIGSNGAEFVNLKKGDIIFSAEQTKELFQRSSINTRGRLVGNAFASGTLNKVIGSGSDGWHGITNNDTSSSSASSSDNSSASEEAKETLETFDWIEIAITRIEEELNRLDKKSGNVYSLWSKRNTALNGQIAKTREEIILQQKAYDDYMAKANSIGLSDTYVSKVQNGTIQIEDITDENLADKISEYQTWYEKAIKCKDTIQGLNISLGDLASQKFDNLQTEYDGVISTFESFGSLVDETIKRTEEHGYFVAKDYYKQLIDYENKTLNTLQQQYVALIQSRDEALRNGDIEENSQEWQNMTQSILDVENAIEQSTTSVVKFNKEIRNLDWETFDYIAERINQITQESDYLIDLMENNNLYNETGAFTSEGKATTALHGINYNIYMQQALDYAKELKDIEQEISKDSANKDLIERREELLELQQDAITNAEAEKDAIKSLVEEGINIHLDALSSLIDKYGESMNSAKNLYDYQKNISSQVKEISKLEKQILAYDGDDSEEARKIIQETKLSLEEARTELKETEWDKYISETEQLLDTLYDDYEEVLNARLDNLDALVAGMIDMVNSNGSEIRNTIKDVADKVGYTITDSLSKALGDGSNVNLLISNFSTKFDTAATTLQSSIDAIKSYVYKMTDEGKNKVTSETKTHTNPSSPNSSTSSNSTHNSSNVANTTSSSNSSSTTSNSGDGTARVGDAVTFVNGKYHEDSWGNGKSGNQLLGGTVYITKIAPNSPYPYHISRTSKFGEANLGWVKLEQLKGYAKGSRRINQNQLAWTQENGNEMLYRSKDGALLTPLSNGDMVFTNEMTQKLWEMANGNIAMPTFNPPKINTNLEQENKTINNDNKITITLPNVKNYDEFKSELQNDNKFVGFVQEVTLGEALGHNSMKRKKY